MSNVKNGWLVFFGYQYSLNYLYGAGNLVNQFRKDGKKILWLNPIPNRSLKLSSVSGNKKYFLKRLLRKIKYQLRFIQIPSRSYYVFSPFYFPFVESQIWNRINKFLYENQVAFIMKFLRIQGRIIFMTSGTNDVSNIIKKNKYYYWIHNAGDLYFDLRNIDSERKSFLYKLEEKIFLNCNIILAASRNIYGKILKMGINEDKVFYFPHGADYNHFAKEYTVSKNISHILKPVVGYFGSLTEANDQNILIEIAKSGFNLVLIGEILADFSECKKYKNIYFLGPVSYNDLPSYAKHFDVGIMNWKPAEWINNCNPKKTYEYLSLGLPIVSVSIPQLQFELSEFIYFADNPKDFVKQIKKAIDENNDELIKKRKIKAKSESWESKYTFLLDNIKNV